MTKHPFEKNEQSEKKLFDNVSDGDLTRKKERPITRKRHASSCAGIRRTLTMINLNRKRNAQFSTLNLNGKKKRTRRLSFMSSKKHSVAESPLKNVGNISSSLPFITDQCKLKNSHANNGLKIKEISKPVIKFSSITTAHNSTLTNTPKKSTFKAFRQKFRNNLTIESLQSIRKQSILNIDQQLKEYIEKQSSLMQTDSQNEELNNKIDLEIRILDGILKLLNAICSANAFTSSTTNQSNHHSSQSNANSTFSSSQLSNTSSATAGSSTSTSTQSAASILISNLNMHSLDDLSKCSLAGAEIAAAIISNKIPAENSAPSAQTYQLASSSVVSIQSGSSNTNHSATVFDSAECSHIYQILNACKCLYVSHRKIAIYLQNLHDLEKVDRSASLTSAESDESDIVNVDDKDENLNNKSQKVKSKSKTNNKPLSNLDCNSMIENKEARNLKNELIGLSTAAQSTCKLMLKDLRIPLSWKWNDHVKAVKNSENVNAKFATFAIVHLGNMIYDTQLISNIDASVTEICFTETFIFDDVKQNDFEITIEFYSYELFNTTNNILQSARKLAKQFTDFATFRRNSNNNNNNFLQSHSLFTNSSNNYSYSMHKFKLVGRALLTAKDVSNEVETRSLQLVNDINYDQSNGTSGASNNGNINIQTQNTLSAISTTAKLPLFDYYSCCLKLLPTSSFI